MNTSISCTVTVVMENFIYNTTRRTGFSSPLSSQQHTFYVPRLSNFFTIDELVTEVVTETRKRFLWQK